MLAPPPAQASWFEFCDLGGEIRAVSQDVPGTLYRLTVKVSTTARAKDRGEDSYIDCTGYLHADLEVLLRFPAPVTIPRFGDRVLFNRVVVELVGIEGHSGGLQAVTMLQAHQPAPIFAQPEQSPVSVWK
jgi:hypothetical protein